MVRIGRITAVIMMTLLIVRRVTDALHFCLFGGSKIGQVAHEEDESPVVVGVVVRSRHARQADAISDDAVGLTIGEALRLRLAKIGRFRVEVPTSFRVSASVIGMAERAMIGEMF